MNIGDSEVYIVQKTARRWGFQELGEFHRNFGYVGMAEHLKIFGRIPYQGRGQGVEYIKLQKNGSGHGQVQVLQKARRNLICSCKQDGVRLVHQ